MRLLLLDRDGVINEHIDPYVLRWEDFRYTRGTIQTLVRASRAGFSPYVVTNQSIIGRGFVSKDFVEQVHAKILSDVSEAGGTLLGVAVCPHTPEAGCGCRKPETGMLEAASAATGLPLDEAWLIGDAGSDLEAGRRAGVARLFHVCSGRDVSVCGQKDVTCLREFCQLNRYITPSRRPARPPKTRPRGE